MRVRISGFGRPISSDIRTQSEVAVAVVVYVDKKSSSGRGARSDHIYCSLRDLGSVCIGE